MLSLTSSTTAIRREDIAVTVLDELADVAVGVVSAT